MPVHSLGNRNAFHNVDVATRNYSANDIYAILNAIDSKPVMKNKRDESSFGILKSDLIKVLIK